MRLIIASGIFFALPSSLLAHEGHSHPQSPQAKKAIERLNTERPEQYFVALPNSSQSKTRPKVATWFDRFSANVSVRVDHKYAYVESDGMPNHSMMTGITSWQQQVPLPQPYRGANAWRIPLHPVPAKKPLSAKSNFFRGAIALAVNGVPIFNPIKNDGRTDTLKAGELDRWGGHCGRADDYHYHIAPVHLEKIVGAGQPIAVALDGYPIYGYNDPNGRPPSNLDWLNGHKGPDGKYHYHATRAYPYLNGGFYGEVVERGGQVDPQPRARGIRPAMSPLRGAKIVGFENPKPGSYVLRYEVYGRRQSVHYTLGEDGSATFRYVSSQGERTESYRSRDRRGDAPVEWRGQWRGQWRGNSERGERGERSSRDPIAAVFDANHDGVIDAGELRKATVALRKLDVNNDGRITADELQGSPHGDRRPERRPPRRSEP